MEIDKRLLINIEVGQCKKGWYWYRHDGNGTFEMIKNDFPKSWMPFIKKEFKMLGEQGRIYVNHENPGRPLTEKYMIKKIATL